MYVHCYLKKKSNVLFMWGKCQFKHCSGFSIFYQLWNYYWFLKTSFYTWWDSFLKIKIIHTCMQGLVFIKCCGSAMSRVYPLLMGLWISELLLQLVGLMYYLICTEVSDRLRFFFFIKTLSNNFQPYKVCIWTHFPSCTWFPKFRKMTLRLFVIAFLNSSACCGAGFTISVTVLLCL